MRRVYRFQICTAQAKDNEENQIARIITKSNSRTDWLEYERKSEKRWEKKAAKFKTSEPVSEGLDGIDIKGAWTAAHAGPDQLARWRKDNIKVDDFATASAE